MNFLNKQKVNVKYKSDIDIFHAITYSVSVLKIQVVLQTKASVIITLKICLLVSANVIQFKANVCEEKSKAKTSIIKRKKRLMLCVCR